MTLPNVVPEEVITSDGWNDIVDQLNNLPMAIQSGSITATSDGNGDITVTFPEEFAANPVVTATRVTGANVQIGLHIASLTPASVTFTCTSNDSVQVSQASIVINWIAVGVLA